VVTPSETIISDVQVAFALAPIAESVSNEVVCASADIPYDLSQKDIEALGGQNPDIFTVSYYSSFNDAQLGVNELPKSYPKVPGTETIYVRVSSLENPPLFLG
jgi:hypothetical protein